MLRCLDSHTVRMDLSSSFLILTTHSVKASRWSGCEILKFLVGKSCNDLVPGKAILTKTQTTRNRKTGKLVFIPVKDGRTAKDTIKPGRRLTKPSLTKEASRETKACSGSSQTGVLVWVPRDREVGIGAHP